ncbi:hypothetical protein GMRT_15191 [Giardia muris]|uniref:Uncharacterized protein n=1 Tax=Giardia muris TaxID=5742 RepID=A0A4Z1T4W9_GIAMU|nr:hypothetical protein GMRT_15191 [Giardia muris]|eukprot:TNJ28127.1 hypothetical protein GMRT_15191 [Giardia muris]
MESPKEPILAYIAGGIFVHGALRERILTLAGDAQPFLRHVVAPPTDLHHCLALYALHLDEEGVLLDDELIHAVTPGDFDLVSTHIALQVLYGLPQDEHDSNSSETLYQRAMAFRARFPDSRAQRRYCHQHQMTYLVLYLKVVRGCGHYVSSTTLYIRELNASLGIGGTETVACPKCCDAHLLKQQIFGEVDLSCVRFFLCTACDTRHTFPEETMMEPVNCTACNGLLHTHCCPTCHIVHCEDGWIHCEKCDRCHPLQTSCALSDDFCVICQELLSDPASPAVRLMCGGAHIVHITCLLKQLAAGNYTCPFRCGPTFPPLSL